MANYKRQELIRLLQKITNSDFSSLEFLLEEYSIKFPFKNYFINELSFIAYTDYVDKFVVDKFIKKLKKTHNIK